MRIIRIGRSQSNHYVLQHPSVSSSHADLRVLDNGIMEYTDHSTNGTLVNGRFVHNATVRLQGHEVLEFPGHIRVRVSEIVPPGGTVVENLASNRYEDRPPRRPSSFSSYNPEVSRQEPEASTPVQGMGFGETLTYYFQHYADFSGRARRQEYWYIVLWNVIFMAVPFVDIIWAVATIIPGLAVSVRRLHDTGRSGTWLLLALIPVVGFIVILMSQRSSAYARISSANRLQSFLS